MIKQVKKKKRKGYHLFFSKKTYLYFISGTLTEDSLDVHGTRVSKQSAFEEETNNVEEINPKFVELLSSCHSLVKMNERFIGDPLDIKMFQFTKKKYVEDSETKNVKIIDEKSNTEIEIIKRL